MEDIPGNVTEIPPEPSRNTRPKPSINIKILKILILLLVIVSPLVFDPSIHDPLIPNAAFDYPKQYFATVCAFFVMFFLFFRLSAGHSLSKPGGPAILFMFVFCGWCFLGSLWSQAPMTVLWDSCLLLVYMFLLLGFAVVFSDREFTRFVIRIMFVEMVLLSVYGILQYFELDRIPVPVLSERLRFHPIMEYMGKRAQVTGFMGNQVFFAVYLGLGIPLIVSQLGQLKGTAGKILHVTGLGIIIAVILLTHTRTIILGLAGFFLFWLITGMYMITTNSSKHVRESRIKKTLVIVIIMVTVLIFFLVPSLSQRFTGIFRPDQGSVASRIYTWRVTWEIVKEHFIAGTGFGSFQLEYYNYQSEVNRDRTAMPHPGNYPLVARAHNEYLQLLAETGMIGLGLVLASVICMFASLHGKLKSPVTRGEDKELYVCAAGTLLLGGFASLFLFPARIIPSLTVLFMALGIAVGEEIPDTD